MLFTKDIINIIFPVLSHWIIWIIFFLMVIIVLVLYAYPYLKKSGKEFHYQHMSIPITGIISLYIFIKMLEGVIYQESILKVDVLVSEIVLNLNSLWINKIALFITTFGSTIVIGSLFILALAVLFLKKRWRYALLSTIALLGALILVTTIKALIHRTRPENLIETGFSFPSGHAILAIVFVSLLIYSFKDDFKNKIIKYVLIIMFSSFFIAVGISRIILHVHWFSDVIAGMSLGLFWFMFLVLIEKSIEGIAPAIKTETKEAKPIVPKILSKTIKN